MTSNESQPLVLDYLGDYRFVNHILFWKAKSKYINRVDLLIRIEDELMRNLKNIGVQGLSYCVPWVDMDGLEERYKNSEPTGFYHSDRHKTK